MKVNRNRAWRRRQRHLVLKKVGDSKAWLTEKWSKSKEAVKETLGGSKKPVKGHAQPLRENWRVQMDLREAWD